MTQTAQAWLKPEQVDALMDAAYRGDGYAQLRVRNETLVLFLYDTGLRVSEAAAVDVDLLEREDYEAVYLPTDLQKDFPTDDSPSATAIELGGDCARRVRTWLSTRWKDSDALFPSRESERMSAEQIRNVVKQLAERADVRPYLADGGRGTPADVHPHTLRHSVAYRMLRFEEADIYDVQNRLRHKRIQTTIDKYSHFDRV